MRKLIAVMVLLCGAASTEAAEPQKWCSGGFEKPARVLFDPGTDTGGDRFEITIGGKPQKYSDAEDSDTLDTIRGADVILYTEGSPEPAQKVIIYRDRVFWPCDSDASCDACKADRN